MAIDVVLYFYAWAHLQGLKPLSLELSEAVQFFMIGSVLSLFALLLLMFGYGWKRLPLALLCLISLPLWYVFTAY